MRIGDFVKHHLVTAEWAESLTDAATRMVEAGVGSLVVLRGGRLAGIVTERDLVRAIADGHSPRVACIASYMTGDPAVALADEDSSVVAARMGALGIRHLPVLDGGVVCGVVSARDLMLREALPRHD